MIDELKFELRLLGVNDIQSYSRRDFHYTKFMDLHEPIICNIEDDLNTKTKMEGLRKRYPIITIMPTDQTLIIVFYKNDLKNEILAKIFQTGLRTTGCIYSKIKKDFVFALLTKNIAMTTNGEGFKHMINRRLKSLENQIQEHKYEFDKNVTRWGFEGILSVRNKI